MKFRTEVAFGEVFELVANYDAAKFCFMLTDHKKYGIVYEKFLVASQAYETMKYLLGLSEEQEKRLFACYRAYCKYCLKFYREPSADAYSQMAEFIKAG